MMVPHISSFLGANASLNCRDAVVLKMKPNLSYNGHMELRNASFNSAQQLFLPDLITKVAKKSSCTLLCMMRQSGSCIFQKTAISVIRKI